MKKRLIAMLLTVCLSAAIFIVPAAAHGSYGIFTPVIITKGNSASLFVGPFSKTLPFVDVQVTDPFVDAVRFVYHEDIMKGVTVTEFCPNDGLNRAMAAQLLYNMASKPGAAPAKFSDVSVDDWFEDAVGWAASMDIVNGYDDGTFLPKKEVTREQFIVMLHRYAGFRKVDEGYAPNLKAFTDVKEIGDWAFASFQWAVANGILEEESGELNPKDTATRAEVAQMLWNYCKAVANNSTFFTPSYHFSKPAVPEKPVKPNYGHNHGHHHSSNSHNGPWMK